jgi:hypothetical protein
MARVTFEWTPPLLAWCRRMLLCLGRLNLEIRGTLGGRTALQKLPTIGIRCSSHTTAHRPWIPVIANLCSELPQYLQVVVLTILTLRLTEA